MICSCGKPSENRTTGLCASCSRAERKAETEALKPKKIYTIKKVSDKRKVEDKQYAKLRREYLQEHPECQIKLFGCTYVATEIHHLESRGIRLNKVESFLSSCPECHRFLHDKLSAKEARDLGFKK
jgi:hypothetical protein